MTIKIDFNMYHWPGNAYNFKIAECFFNANKNAVYQALYKASTKKAIDDEIYDPIIIIDASEKTAFNLPVIALHFELIKWTPGETTFALIGLTLDSDFYNPNPGNSQKPNDLPEGHRS